MRDEPYIVYPSTASPAVSPEGGSVYTYISEQNLVSFGVVDFVSGTSFRLHYHNTWEIIIVDNSSEGPGYTNFNGKWWMVDPGAAVFIPKGYPHSWSCGNNNVFKMLWIYGGTREEAGRFWEDDNKTTMLITPEEERLAVRWA